MAATGEFTESWSGGDINPYTSPNMDNLNIAGKLSNGALRAATSTGGPCKYVYNGAVDRSQTLYARVELVKDGGQWYDYIGPAMTDLDWGVGYWFTVHGSECWLAKQTTMDGAGAILGLKLTGQTFVDGDIFEISITPSGDIVCKQNANTLISTNDTSFFSTLSPAAQANWDGSNVLGMGSFGADGVSGVIQPPSWNDAPNPPPPTVGTPYSYDFSALLDGDQPIVVSSIGDPLPDGLSVTASTIEGTPTAAGVFANLILNATGANDSAASTPFSMQVISSGTAPHITGVNADDSVVSGAAGYITGEGFTGIVYATLGNTTLSITVETDLRITYEAVDFHSTTLSPIRDENIKVFIDEGSASFPVAIKMQADNIFIVAKTIDSDPTHPGLLGTTTTLAAVGDGYEGPQYIDGTATVYYADGPHREIQAAVPNGTTSVGWHFDDFQRVWEQINETTNQTSAPGATLSNPGNVEPVADTTIGVTVDTNVGRGTIYVVATLTSELPNPTPEEIKAGVGESAVSFVVTAAGSQEPAYLEGLDPSTRYWYWIVQDTDGLNTFSNVASGTALTTATPVGTPGEAILTNPFTGVSGGTFGSVGVTSSSSLGMLYFVAMLEPEEPSEDDIKFGIGAASHSSAVPKVGVNGPYLLDGLDSTQLYYYWFVQDTNTDESGE